MKTPFGTNLPLSESPYNSRISTNIDNDKNYYLNAFNPGYALQASELNELQELFFFNLNLTQRSNSAWMTAAYNVPFWNGCIPATPSNVQITASSVSGGAATFTVTLSNAWYLWTEKNSSMSFWIYNDLADTSFTFTTTSGIGSTEYVGFEVTNETIKCCQAADCAADQDSTLRDNSSGLSDTYYTCGASRLKASVTDALILTATTASTFFPIFKVTIDTATTATYKFLDDQDVIIL
jgi:hypothetical protein